MRSAATGSKLRRFAKHLIQPQYGDLAGLNAYSVPQVLAATLPVGALSSQIDTIVKLLRVLMLGPVVLGIAYVVPERQRRRWPGSASTSTFAPLRSVAAGSRWW